MGLIAGFIFSVFSSVFANYLYESTPAAARWIIKKSAGRLHVSGDRYLCEWLAHFEVCESHWQRLNHAVGCFAASLKMNNPAKMLRAVFLYTFYFEPEMNELRRKARIKYDPIEVSKFESVSLDQIDSVHFPDGYLEETRKLVLILVKIEESFRNTQLEMDAELREAILASEKALRKHSQSRWSY